MILHADMDAFYASVEVRDRPELQGKPVIVGGSPEGRGVVAAANYEARKFGIHSAMPASRAKRLCPQLIILRARMNYYADVARNIRRIFYRYTPLVEPLALDEAFLDATGSEMLFGTPIEIGRKIKNEIRDELQLVASIGVAPNKFLAKIASDLQKPDGFVVVDPNGIQPFLDPLPVGRLWGVGRATGKVFQRLGLQTIGDVRRLNLTTLRHCFGAHGEHLWHLARGIDNRRVVPDQIAKSISHETTFAEDIHDLDWLRAWSLELSDQVARRLRRHGRQAKTMHLKVRFQDFRTITRSSTRTPPTDVTQEIWREIDQMLSSRLPDSRLPVRLLGVGASGLVTNQPSQLTLFEQQELAAQSNLDRATDQIREKFGAAALTRASGLYYRVKHGPQSKPPDEEDGPPGR